MISKEEIILMTKLALHEKKYNKEDRKRNSYYKWDYIYMKNWWTRFAVGIAAAIIIGWLVFRDVYIKEIIPIFEIELGRYLYKYIIGFLILIAIYSVISTIVHKRKYEETQKRLYEYESMIKELDQFQNLRELREEEIHDTAQSDVPDSRNTY